MDYLSPTVSGDVVSLRGASDTLSEYQAAVIPERPLDPKRVTFQEFAGISREAILRHGAEERAFVQTAAERRVRALLASAPDADTHAIRLEAEAAIAEKLELLRDIMSLTKKAMVRMNLKHPGIPPDSVQTTLDLVTRPGSVVVAIKAVVPGQRDTEPQLLGYGIVIKGIDNAPDGHELPEELRRDPKACRVIRLFIEDPARQMLVEQQLAFGALIGAVKEVSEGAPIYGKLLTHIVPIEGQFAKDLSIDIWKRAEYSMSGNGFEMFGDAMQEEFTHPDRRKVAVSFRWAAWPPRSEAGREAARQYAETFASAGRRRQERHAAGATVIPAIDELVLVYGTPEDGLFVSELHKRDVVVSTSSDSPAARKRSRTVRAANLIQRPFEPSGRLVSDESAGAVIVLGMLPDFAGSDPLSAKENVKSFLSECAAQLKPGKSLLVRDTMSPDGPRRVLATYDLATAELFDKFIAERREGHISESEWAQVTRSPCERADAKRYLVPARIEAEFRYKFPHAETMDDERSRFYTLFTPEEFRQLLGELGLRVVAAAPVNGVWQNEHFYRGKVSLSDLRGRELPPTPTNYLFIAEKAPPGEGVKITQQARETLNAPGYLTLTSYAERRDGPDGPAKVWELAAREGAALDVVPHCIVGDRLMVRGRIYRRDITTAHLNRFDGASGLGFLAEQLTAPVDSAVLTSPEAVKEKALGLLSDAGGVRAPEILAFGEPLSYFSHPDTVDERVVAQPVRISPQSLEDTHVDPRSAEYISPITTRMFDAVQILHACQAGGMQEPRLERMVYHLLARNGLSAGTWLGEHPLLPEQSATALRVARCAELLDSPARQVFERLPDTRLHFFDVMRGRFNEISSDGRNLVTRTRDYIVPSPEIGLSSNLASVLPAVRVVRPDGGTEILVGLELRDFAAVQNHTASSTLLTLPSFRLDERVRSDAEMHAAVTARMREEFGANVQRLWNLGQPYFSTPGCTPDLMFPLLAEIRADDPGLKNLHFVRLRDLLNSAGELRCGRLMTAAYRAGHALGEIG